MPEMLEKYARYLRVIDTKIQEFFEQQKPYIFCKERCSICCEKGKYPYTKLEFDFLMCGFGELSLEIKNEVGKKVDEIKAAQKEWNKNSDPKNFTYVCPFLIDKKCSLYPYRGLICRVFGIAWYKEDGSINIPYCVDMGLNYSNVFDKGKKCFSKEMFEKTGFSEEPLAFNVSLKSLRQNDGVDYLGLQFGETRALIDWL